MISWTDTDDTLKLGGKQYAFLGYKIVRVGSETDLDSNLGSDSFSNLYNLRKGFSLLQLQLAHL